jgi:hypothetical protein
VFGPVWCPPGETPGETAAQKSTIRAGLSRIARYRLRREIETECDSFFMLCDLLVTGKYCPYSILSIVTIISV